jgi:hypothetical protein
MRFLLLTTLLSIINASPTAEPDGGNWCPRGSWQDNNGICHHGRPGGDAVPVGWVDRDGSQHIWASSPSAQYPYGSGSRTYTLPDGTRITVGDTRYNAKNNPAIFFDARFQDKRDIQPMRDVKGGVPYLAWMNWKFARKMRLVHGVISSIAFMLLFPMGAIIVNLGPGMCGVFSHVGLQILGWLFYLIGAAAGLWMVSAIRWRGFNFVSDSPELWLC